MAWNPSGRVRALLALLLVLLGAASASPRAAVAAACVVTSAADSGPGTLREKVADTNCGPITFQAGLGAVTLATRIVVSRTVTVEGAGQIVQHTGGYSANGSVLWVTGGTVVLRGLIIQGGRSETIWGAGLSISGGNVTLEGAIVRDNHARSAGGGGIYAANGTLRLTNTIVESNRVEGVANGLIYGGGGLFIDDYHGPVTATIEGGSQIRNNSATVSGIGGGIRVVNRSLDKKATLTLDNAILSGNSADIQGGGLASEGDTVSLTNATISGNSASSGGGLHVAEGNRLTLTNSVVSGNTASNSGGGLLIVRAWATLTNTTVHGNRAAYGGGVHNTYSTLTLTASAVSGNTASTSGGGIYIYDYDKVGTTTLNNATISGNTARVGGGLHNDFGIATLTNTTVVGNSGGVSIYGTTATHLRGSIVVGNGPQDCREGDDSTHIVTAGGNVVGNASGCPIGGGDVAVGALAAVLDPLLSDNGDRTRTHNLVPGSPAIDRIACLIPTDQRGVTRPQGAACDSGAVEYVAAAPSPPAPAAVALTVDSSGSGTVDRNPGGTGDGPYAYPVGTVVTLAARPGAGQAFVGWVVDGEEAGWAPVLTLTMDTAHTARAAFAPVVAFPDVPIARPDSAAIAELATRGTIRGYADGTYGPDDTVQRAQMAALIARAVPVGLDAPPATLAPPACLVPGTWDCEDWGNSFQDRNGLNADLWRNIGTFQHYRVTLGYDGDACQKRGVSSPCYAPTAPVSYVETITFITRAMVAKGYWQPQPGAAQPYGGVPAVFATEVATYHHYTQGAGGIPAPPQSWSGEATRGWFARALWTALNSHWGTAP